MIAADPRASAALADLPAAAASEESPAPIAAGVRVAYIMSRFPKLTETFVLYEMLAVEALGAAVDIYPLRRERTREIHPEAAPLVERARFAPWLSLASVRANFWFLRHRPRVYLGALAALLRGTFGSARYFAGALALFPKAALFARQMLADGVTHVHAHFASHPAAAAFVIGRLTGIPYSFTAHGSDLHRDSTMLREKVAEAAFAVPISEYNRSWMQRACGAAAEGKLEVIHCGVDPQVFYPVPAAARRAADGSERRFTLVCTGTLHEVKGQRVLIEACALLASRGVEFTCLLIGDGPDRASLERQIERAALTDRVKLLGRRTRADVAELLRGADVVVAPSVPTRNGRREGIPVVLMEAAACGLPLVASRLSGIPELVEDGEVGLLTPPGDAGALADALERLAREPLLRRRLGERGRERVIEAFNVSRSAEALARRFTGAAT